MKLLFIPLMFLSLAAHAENSRDTYVVGKRITGEIYEMKRAGMGFTREAILLSCNGLIDTTFLDLTEPLDYIGFIDEKDSKGKMTRFEVYQHPSGGK